MAEELQKKGIEVNRKIIVVKDVKEVGSYVAQVKLHKDVTASLAFEVVAENAPAPAPVAAPAPVVEQPAAEEAEVEAPAAE